jgi:hypothetical protein
MQIKVANNIDGELLAVGIVSDAGIRGNDAIFVSRSLARNVEQVVTTERRSNALHRIDPDVERIVAVILDKIKNAELVVA